MRTAQPGERLRPSRLPVALLWPTGSHGVLFGLRHRAQVRLRPGAAATASASLLGAVWPGRGVERIATALGDAALHLLADHGADLGGIRRVAEEDPGRERKELTRYVGVRDRAVDGFFREIQLLWKELLPFAEKTVLDASSRLGLGDGAAALRGQVVSDEDFVRLADALLRARHDDDGLEEVRQHAHA